MLLLLSHDFYSQERFGSIKKLYEEDGLRVSFLYYKEGDGSGRSGVVIFLENNNEFEISFSFTLIFRSEGADKEERLEGSLKAFEKRTGSTSGLYFLPFSDNRSIIAVGIKNFKVTGKASIIKLPLRSRQLYTSG
ncbi:MAG: hypothetical protein HXY49_08910 [Ignavibacteriaceae bacterium]|nr:hypothetical protein [Ignavibacteriaceae bacterium]